MTKAQARQRDAARLGLARIFAHGPRQPTFKRMSHGTGEVDFSVDGGALDSDMSQRLGGGMGPSPCVPSAEDVEQKQKLERRCKAMFRAKFPFVVVG